MSRVLSINYGTLICTHWHNKNSVVENDDHANDVIIVSFYRLHP